jgi:hypothetical protein
MRRFSILPLVCFALMFAYAAYGAVVVGHWPYYAHPDPKELPLPRLFAAVAIITLAGALSLLLLPIGYATWRLALRLKHRAVPTHRTWVGLYAAGAMLWVADFAALHGRLPWHSVLNWILD